MDLKTPIKNHSRVLKMYASRLEKLGIKNFEDFLYHFPHRYDDYSVISKISKLQEGKVITIQGTVLEIKNQYTSRFRKLQKAKIQDETGIIDVLWFNQPYLVKNIKIGDKINLSGRVGSTSNKLTMQSPDYEIINPEQEAIHTGRLVPVYPETRGVSSKWLRRQVNSIIKENKENLFEYLPDSILENNNLIDFLTAIEQIHFPKSFELAEKSRYRLSFDELFLMQLKALSRRKEWKEKIKGTAFQIEKNQTKIDKFIKSIPFELTNAQKKAVEEILKDLQVEKPMNRLLEGDVGSGKTVVSAIALYTAHLNGFQSVLMAPTEILAGQHYKTLTNLLSPFGIKVDLLTRSKKFPMSNIKSQINTNQKIKKEKNNLELEIGYSKFDILVGTHAVLSKKINFKNLGLVVIDEQQRFGVEQRAIIKQKGNNPHLLTMTATPIPRTVALTMYGDLDLSYLNEMPKGRKKVRTWLVPPEKRGSGYKWIESQIKEFKTQAFIICPFIEPSENMATVKSATQEFEKLKKVFPKLKLGLLHGKLKAKEKDSILLDFKNKKFDILVATPVVEVGIDIPNAAIIIIEASERFGLSQLHQLRGRVGRGDQQSYCLLFTESKNPKTVQRLKSMETIYNGAELAELDLKLRGPGEIYGTMQHGLPSLKIASFSDFDLIQKTKIEASKIFKNLSNYPKLTEKLLDVTVENISPD